MTRNISDVPASSSTSFTSCHLAEAVDEVYIHVLQRRAYRYHDEECLKLKIIAVFLPPLFKIQQKMPHTNPRSTPFIESSNPHAWCRCKHACIQKSVLCHIIESPSFIKSL